YELAYSRRVALGHSAAQRIRQQFFGDRSHELAPMSSREQRLAKILRAGDRLAVEGNAGVDRGPPVVLAKLTNRVEVFERETQRIHPGMTAGAHGIRAMLFHSFTQRRGLLSRRVFLEGRY